MFPRRLARATTARGVLAGLILASAASAQVPGVPVLQNAFVNPGLAAAANYAGGAGQNYFGAAVGWGPGSGRFLVSAGAGAQRSNGSSRGAYGARASMSIWTSGSGAMAVGAFAGLGGAPSTHSGDTLTNAATTLIPVGAAFGYRRALGSRGISAYVSPMYVWANNSGTAPFNMATSAAGGFRVGLGVDLGLTSAFGFTLGSQFGGTSSGGGSGTGSGLAAAFTFVPGR